MMYYGSGLGGWGMVLMTVGSLLFWGLVIVGIVVLVRRPGRGAPFAVPAAQARTPAQVLADRFAHGDIDEVEYRERLQVLHPAAPVSSASD